MRFLEIKYFLGYIQKLFTFHISLDLNTTPSLCELKNRTEQNSSSDCSRVTNTKFILPYASSVVNITSGATYVRHDVVNETEIENYCEKSELQWRRATTTSLRTPKEHTALLAYSCNSNECRQRSEAQ